MGARSARRLSTSHAGRKPASERGKARTAGTRRRVPEERGGGNADHAADRARHPALRARNPTPRRPSWSIEPRSERDHGLAEEPAVEERLRELGDLFERRLDRDERAELPLRDEGGEAGEPDAGRRAGELVEEDQAVERRPSDGVERVRVERHLGPGGGAVQDGDTALGEAPEGRAEHRAGDAVEDYVVGRV